MQINKLLTQINWQKSWLAQRISSLINIKTTDFPDYCSSPKHLISSQSSRSGRGRLITASRRSGQKEKGRLRSQNMIIYTIMRDAWATQPTVHGQFSLVNSIDRTNFSSLTLWDDFAERHFQLNRPNMQSKSKLWTAQLISSHYARERF